MHTHTCTRVHRSFKVVVSKSDTDRVTYDFGTRTPGQKKMCGQDITHLLFPPPLLVILFWFVYIRSRTLCSSSKRVRYNSLNVCVGTVNAFVVQYVFFNMSDWLMRSGKSKHNASLKSMRLCLYLFCGGRGVIGSVFHWPSWQSLASFNEPFWKDGTSSGWVFSTNESEHATQIFTHFSFLFNSLFAKQ